jgi:hypothetical protein
MDSGASVGNSVADSKNKKDVDPMGYLRDV